MVTNLMNASYQWRSRPADEQFNNQSDWKISY